MLQTNLTCNVLSDVGRF